MSFLNVNVNRPVAITAPMNVVVPSVPESGFVPFTPDLKAPNITVQEELIVDGHATGQNGVQNPILGALLSNNNGSHRNGHQVDAGPLRLLCQGRELTADLDEKSVLEIGLRDGSIIHVQAGGAQSNIKVGHHGSLTQGLLRDHSPGQIGIRDKSIQGAPPPDPASMPMALLSTPDNWQLLMNLIKLLIEKASTVSACCFLDLDDDPISVGMVMEPAPFQIFMHSASRGPPNWQPNVERGAIALGK